MNRSTIWAIAVLSVGAFFGWLAAAGQFQSDQLLAAEPKANEKSPYEYDRTVLPIPEPKLAPITILDARDATAPPRFAVKAPQGAPNVVIVLIDDIGFGHSSAFGGP